MIYLPTFMNGWFLWQMLGKYTIPMDPMGNG